MTGAMKHLWQEILLRLPISLKELVLGKPQLELKKDKKGKKQDPWWKRCIDGDIKKLKKETNIRESEKKAEISKKGEKRSRIYVINGSRHSRMNQTKFVEDTLYSLGPFFNTLTQI